MKTMWIPGDRLASVLERADVTLSDEERRLLQDLRRGAQEFVSLHRADRILTRLDLDGWWHIPREDGGLADIYEDGAQYGEPKHVAVSRLPRPQMRKYKTEEERRAARRATWQRSYERRKQRRLEDAA